MEREGAYLSADEAAARLGITRATLYAYVSRGQLRSERLGGGRRERRYHADDVARMAERRAQRAHPERAAQGALHWGSPLLDSALTLIEGERLFYRGYDALALAETARMESVAALLWSGDEGEAEAIFGARHEMPPAVLRALEALQTLAPVERMTSVLPVANAHDAAAYDLRPRAVAQTGARIVRLLACVLAGTRASASPLIETLAARWGDASPEACRLIERALILCADHELNASSFTARCAASAGATPYAVVTAGMCTLQGYRHGRQIERVERILQDAAYSQGAAVAVARRLRLGEQIPGFGHPLYPHGDPRARAILGAVSEAFPDHPAVVLSHALCDEVQQTIGEAPVLDYALVILARAAALPEGAALGLFALGRSVGWVAHAIEQYADPRLIRPRARYTGELPP